MKKIFFTLFLFILFLSFKTNTYALGAACTSEEQMRLRNLVTATKITFEYYEDINSEVGGTFHGFNVTISNFKSDFYVYNEEKGIFFNSANETTATTSGFTGGITYNLPFYGSEGTACDGYLIMTKYVKVPLYNKHWDNPLCIGHESYILCKKFTSLVVDSQAEFEQRMSIYIKSLEIKGNDNPVIDKPVEEKTLFQKVIDFIIDKYMYFLVSIITLGTIFIVIIEVKKRRSIL